MAPCQPARPQEPVRRTLRLSSLSLVKPPLESDLVTHGKVRVSSVVRLPPPSVCYSILIEKHEKNPARSRATLDASFRVTPVRNSAVTSPAYTALVLVIIAAQTLKDGTVHLQNLRHNPCRFQSLSH